MTKNVNSAFLSDEAILCFVGVDKVKHISPVELAQQEDGVTTEDLAGIINNTFKIERNKRFFDKFNHIGNTTYFLDRGEVVGILEDLIAGRAL